jgi:hypothetical protein
MTGLIVALLGCADPAPDAPERVPPPSRTVAELDWEALIRACREVYGPGQGYGYCSEPAGACRQAVPESISALEAGCAPAGATVDPSRLLTREAAMCVAVSFGFPPGLEPWRARLACEEGPVWVLEAVTNESDGSRSGATMTLDAYSGYLTRDVRRWSRMP